MRTVLYKKNEADLASFGGQEDEANGEKPCHFEVKIPLMWELKSPTLCEISGGMKI